MKKFLCLGLGLLLLLVAMSSGCRSNDRLPSESGTPSFDDEPHEERIVYDSLTIAEEDLVHLEYWQNDFPLERIEPVRFYTQDGLMPFFYCLTEELSITAYTDQFCRQEMKYNAHDIVHRYEQELYHRAPYRGEISSLYLYCDTFDEVFLKLGIPNAGVTNHTANYRTTDGRLFEIDVQYFEAENREWTYYYGYREITDLQV